MPSLWAAIRKRYGLIPVGWYFARSLTISVDDSSPCEEKRWRARRNSLIAALTQESAIVAAGDAKTGRATRNSSPALLERGPSTYASPKTGILACRCRAPLQNIARRTSRRPSWLDDPL